MSDANADDEYLNTTEDAIDVEGWIERCKAAEAQLARVNILVGAVYGHVKPFEDRLSTTEAALAEAEEARSNLASALVKAEHECDETATALAESRGELAALKDSGLRYCVTHAGTCDCDEGEPCDMVREGKFDPPEGWEPGDYIPIRDMPGVRLPGDEFDCVLVPLLYRPPLEAPHEAT